MADASDRSRRGAAKRCSTHRLTLTPAGKVLRDSAADLLRQIARLREDLDALGSCESTLIFAATQALSFTFFPILINRVAGGSAVQLLADNMRACERIKDAARAQFLLCHTHPEMPINLPMARYRMREIGTDQQVPVTTLRDDRPLYRLDDDQIPLLRFDEQSGLGRILRAAITPSLDRLNLRPVFTSHLAMAPKPPMLEGRGVAWLPESLISADLAAGSCQIMASPEFEIAMSITLIRPQGRVSQLA